MAKEATSQVELRDREGRRCSLHDVSGRPVVAVFTPEVPPSATRQEMRSELRGLGAALVIVTPAAMCLVAPDDPIRLLEPVAPGDKPARLYQLVGAHPARTTLVVVGEDGEVRWRRETADLIGALGRAAAIRQGSGFLPTRREAMVSALIGALAIAVLPRAAEARDADPAAPPPGAGGDPGVVRFSLWVNGKEMPLAVEPRVSLLDALREVLGLTGTKKGCDHGQCGACTVHVDGRRVLSCLTLAIMHQQEKITTIEGLAVGDRLHPMQAAFMENDALQCGFCTPGQIMSAIGCLHEGHARGPDDVRELMSGNICRCGAYPNIVAAIEQVRKG
jgi:xanthine dehydrogenase YagT iron-sulfur-binding subunit